MRFANEFGAGEVDNLPGCTQVAVNHSFFVYPEHRGKGYGQQNHKLRLKRLKELGYNYVLCTVREGNSAQEKILNSNNWNKLSSFDSTKTGNKVCLYGKEL